MAGLEVLQLSLHSLHEEGDYCAAVVCLFLGYLGYLGAYAPVGTASVAAFAPSGGLRVQAVDEGLDLHAGELFEESCGFELVAGLEVFQLAFDSGDEEFDYEAAAVGFFERHLSERLDEFAAGGLVSCEL